MKTVLNLLLIAVVTIVILVLLGPVKTPDTTSPENLQVGEEVSLPEGYSFIGVSAHGKTGGVYTYYCQHSSSGRYYECTNGVVGREIVLPTGYVLVDVASYGETGDVRTYYCQKPDSNRVFTCRPQ